VRGRAGRYWQDKREEKAGNGKGEKRGRAGRWIEGSEGVVLLKLNG